MRKFGPTDRFEVQISSIWTTSISQSASKVPVVLFPGFTVRLFYRKGTTPCRITTSIEHIHGGGKMDKDRVKGTIDDAAGRAKRQVGEWTGDTKTQVEGAAQQVKGKAEKAWGNAKDAARDTNDRANQQNANKNAEQKPVGARK
jgi:uncharacterized protein YjbJ (UPF0337 family)